MLIHAQEPVDTMSDKLPFTGDLVSLNVRRSLICPIEHFEYVVGTVRKHYSLPTSSRIVV